MLTLFFTSAAVKDFDSAKASDTAQFAAFFRAMLESGIYLPPSQFEAWFVSAAHTDVDLDRTLSCVRKALEELPS